MIRTLLFSFTLLFFIGCASHSVEKKSIKSTKQERYEALSKLTATIGRIEKHYVKDVNVDEIVDKAIKGLFHELDESSFYIKGSETITYKYTKQNKINKITSYFESKYTDGNIFFESKYIDENILYLKVPIMEKGISLKIKEEILSKRNKKGIILDLRGNVGGLLSESIKIVDLFIDAGIIVLEKYKNEEKKHYANKNNTIYSGSLIILVDSFTASGSEIISGSLQSHNRAQIVGERTFGSDSISAALQISEDEFINLFVARMYLDNNKSIKNGISPDIVVKESKLQLEKAVDLLN